MHSCWYLAVSLPWTLSWVLLAPFCKSFFILTTRLSRFRWRTGSGHSFAHRHVNMPCTNVCTHMHDSIIYTHSEEDVLASYSRVLMKMFLSEGVMCGHSLFLASASEDPVGMIGVWLTTYDRVCVCVCTRVCVPKVVSTFRIYLQLWVKPNLGLSQAVTLLSCSNPKRTKCELRGGIKIFPKFR